jgi:hypothetical protein
MIERISNLAETLAARVSRRAFLARVSAWAAGLAALFTSSAALAQAATYCVYRLTVAAPQCGLDKGDRVCILCTPANMGTCSDCKTISFLTAAGAQCTITVERVHATCTDCDGGLVITNTACFLT